MDISRQAEDVAALRDFLKNKKPEETERDAVVRYYMELGLSAGVTAAKVVGVIVDGAEIGTVDCALADPASIAVAYAEDKLGVMLGLWTLAEFSPKTAIIVLKSPTQSLVSDISVIIRRSHLLAHSQVRFVLLDIAGARREIIQRKEIHPQRRKIIKGARQPYKKQD
ncbi:MAG: hypothetical protein V1909_04540 [Candidatus Micrarchaeota archaeon]